MKRDSELMDKDSTQPIITTWELLNFQSIRGKITPDGETTPDLKPLTLDLKPLTIFSGPNSSGKSAVIKSLLMVAQSLGSSASEFPLVLNGKYIQLGDFNHILHHGSDSPEMGFGFVIKQQEREIDVRVRIEKPENSALPTSMRVMNSLVSWRDSDEESFKLSLRPAELQEDDKQKSPPIVQEQISQGLFDYEIVKPENIVSSEYEETVAVSLSNFLPGRLLIRINPRIRKLTKDLESVHIGLLSMVQFESPTEAYFSDEDVDVNRELGEGVQKIFGMIRAPHWWDKKFIDTVEEISQSKIPWTIGTLQNYIQARLRDGEIKDLVRRTNSILPEALFILRQAELKFSSEAELEDREFPSRYSQIIQQIRQVFRSQIFYLGPLRDDPRTIYAIPAQSNERDVGLKGEYTAAMLNEHKDTEVYYPEPPKDSEAFNGTYTIFKGKLPQAVLAWLERMGLAEAVGTKMTSKVGYQLEVRPAGVKHDLDLTSLGVGVSQVLPTIVMALLAPKDSILIFEQPEVHLHPKVQSVLGDFFLGIIQCGKQCIVETHSEYFIHRLRRRIAESNDETIREQLGIYFIKLKDGVSQFELVEPNDLGAIAKWPADFFDEAEKESSILARAAMKKRRALRQKQQQK